MIAVLLIVNLIILGMILSSARDHDLTMRRLETVQAFYAAEAGVNMGVREMMNSADEDGDGTVGSISDDGDDGNNPTAGSAAFLVTRTDIVGLSTLASTGTNGIATRAAETTLVLPDPSLPFEVGRITVDDTSQTVDLDSTYTSPVVVCTPHYANGTAPIVVRVDNVTATSFDVWLQNPGDLSTPVAETVWYIVMEEGAWSVDGVKFEAQTYLSTVTSEDDSWTAEAQSYLQAYTTPVVIGQVMSANDPGWSVFWCQGSSRTSPPDASSIGTGKTVCEDADVTRADETVGFIVFEAGSGTMGGLPMDARLSADSVRGVGNNPPYAAPFSTAFTVAPSIILGSVGGMDGDDGGWMVVYDQPPATVDEAEVVVDEDQIENPERSHTSEQVAVVAFERRGVAIFGWAEVGP
jgi:hypothetical protein